MDIFKLDKNKNNHSFNTYLLYEESKFITNQRQDFINRIKKEFLLVIIPWSMQSPVSLILF